MYDAHRDSPFLEKLYLEHYATVYRQIAHELRSRCGSAADAADLTQEVFFTAAEKIEELRVHSNPAGWLIKTAYNKCNNYIRTMGRRREMPDVAPERRADPSDDFRALELNLSIRQMIGEEDYRLLMAYTSRTPEEICREYGISPGTLRVRIHRLRKSLAKFFIFLVTISSFRYM